MDGRKNNGNKGHSTKAKGADKRKNKYREALTQAADVNDVVNVLKMLNQKAISKQDTKAAQIFLEYYLGKPKESIDVHTSGDNSINFTEVLKAISGRDK